MPISFFFKFEVENCFNLRNKNTQSLWRAHANLVTNVSEGAGQNSKGKTDSIHLMYLFLSHFLFSTKDVNFLILFFFSLRETY